MKAISNVVKLANSQIEDKYSHYPVNKTDRRSNPRYIPLNIEHSENVFYRIFA